MKHMNIRTLNIAVTAHNKREEALVRIVNEEIRCLVLDWVTEAGWRLAFEKEGFNYYRFVETTGHITSMFFLDMISEPVSAVELWRACKDEANKEMDAVA